MELWWVRCEKWSCDDLVCDKVWWVVMRSCDVISGSVMSGEDKSTRQPAAGQRRPRAPQLLQQALCSAPATPKAARKLFVLRLPRDSQPRTSGAHARCSSRRLCAPATRKAAAGQRRPRAPQLLQQALCIAPATPKAARKLYLYCACHATASRGPAAPTRAAAPPAGSV